MSPKTHLRNGAELAMKADLEVLRPLQHLLKACLGLLSEVVWWACGTTS